MRPDTQPNDPLFLNATTAVETSPGTASDIRSVRTTTCGIRARPMERSRWRDARPDLPVHPTGAAAGGSVGADRRRVGVGTGAGAPWPSVVSLPVMTSAVPSVSPLHRPGSLFEGRSTNANQPLPSVFADDDGPACLREQKHLRLRETTPSLDTAMPRRWPVVGCVFHVIGGTFAVEVKTGGAIGSYEETCVSARARARHGSRRRCACPRLSSHPACGTSTDPARP
jgi:hypothetical protein